MTPPSSLDGTYDVGFSGGRVVAIAPRLPVEQAADVVDVTGKLVTPGLIDLHGPFYDGVMFIAVSADETCLTNGVTAGIDAGSSNWLT